MILETRLRLEVDWIDEKMFLSKNWRQVMLFARIRVTCDIGPARKALASSGVDIKVILRFNSTNFSCKFGRSCKGNLKAQVNI